MCGPTTASAALPPRVRTASAVRSRTPSARPLQPACAMATTPVDEIRATGTQSATWTASGATVVAVTRASAKLPEPPPGSDTSTTVVPWTW